MSQVIVGVCLLWFRIVDCPSFQSAFSPQTKTRNHSRRETTAQVLHLRRRALSSAALPPPLAPGIAFGIRVTILLLLCTPTTLEPAFSYNNETFCPDASSEVSQLTLEVLCIFSKAQHKTGMNHREFVANLGPFFFQGIHLYIEKVFLFVLQGPPLRGVCVLRACAGCRLRFSTHSVVTVSFLVFFLGGERGCLVFVIAEQTILKKQ